MLQCSLDSPACACMSAPEQEQVQPLHVALVLSFLVVVVLSVHTQNIALGVIFRRSDNNVESSQKDDLLEIMETSHVCNML